MSAFYGACRNELNKLLWRKKYRVFLATGIMICILWAALANLASNLIGQYGGLFINLTPTPMGVLPLFLQFFSPFLVFMAVTDLITTEAAEDTMKAMICRPVERWKLYTAKHLAVITYISLYLICVFVVSTVLNQVWGRALTAGELMATLASYLLAIPILAVLTAFAALIALAGRSATLTMLLLIVIYLTMSILSIIFPILSGLLFTSYLGWYRLWIGVTPGALRLIHMLIIILGYGVVFFTAGSLIFDRKEY